MTRPVLWARPGPGWRAGVASGRPVGAGRRIAEATITLENRRRARDSSTATRCSQQLVARHRVRRRRLDGRVGDDAWGGRRGERRLVRVTPRSRCSSPYRRTAGLEPVEMIGGYYHRVGVTWKEGRRCGVPFPWRWKDNDSDSGRAEGRWQDRLFIGGEWVDGSGEMPVVDPASEEVLVGVGLRRPPRRRGGRCAPPTRHPSRGLIHRPVNAGEILRRTFEADAGPGGGPRRVDRPRERQGLPGCPGEVRYAAEFFRWFSEEAPGSGEVAHGTRGDKRILTFRQPIGVSVMVTPWNFPAAMATRKLGPALAAGCTASSSRRPTHR